MNEKHLLLKDSKEGSKEIFSKFQTLSILKTTTLNFSLGRYKSWQKEAKNLQNKEISPEKRLSKMKNQLKKVIEKISSKAKSSDDKSEQVDKLVDEIKEIAGTIKSLLEIKVRTENLEDKFPERNVPPEYLDFVEIAFEKILKFIEDKGFDWDAFWCSMIGLL